MATTNPFLTPIAPLGAAAPKPAASQPIVQNPNPINLGIGLGNSTASTAPSLGVQAKAPDQNLQKPQTTLPPAQVKQPALQTAVASKTTAPAAPKAPATNQATLYGPNGQKQVVTIGSSQASQLQSQGYGLTPGSYKAPATTGTAGGTTDANAPALITQGGVALYKNPDGTVSPVNPATPPNITSKGLLQDLTKTATEGNPTLNTATTGLLGTATSNPATTGPALEAYNKAVADKAAFDTAQAQNLGDINLTGTPLSFKQGAGQVLQNQALVKDAALQNAINQQQTAIGQQMQGVGVQQAGYTQAGNLGATGQSLTQSGLGTALTAAAPIQGQYGTPLVNQQTGQVMSGAGTTVGNSDLNPLANVDSIAQQVVSGQMSPAQAQAMGGSVGNWQSVLNAAITKINPNYNYNVGTGAAGAQSQNAQIGGTATVTASQGIYNQALSDYANLQTQVSNVDQFGNLLLSGMVDAQGNKINPSDVKYANTSIANVRNQISSSQQAQFDSTFAALKSKISGLLAAGGSEIPSQITADANKVLDGSAPLGTLTDTLTRIQAEGKILLKNQSNKVNQAYSGITGTTTGAGDNGGNTIPAGGYNYSLINGKWTVVK